LILIRLLELFSLRSLSLALSPTAIPLRVLSPKEKEKEKGNEVNEREHGSRIKKASHLSHLAKSLSLGDEFRDMSVN
jgi:hypothetical protein